ncbi:MAG: ATP-binding protein [Paludibaculum sp.]
MLGDSDALRRLFLILIDNAIKYNLPGGCVQIQLGVEGENAFCTVSDSGIGISKEDLDHIFDRFWRADKVRSRGMGGAGLGLSIARWIAMQHEGMIEVTSQPGKGSTFTVKIPSSGRSQWEAYLIASVDGPHRNNSIGLPALKHQAGS